jgi:hypothetical protein
MNGFDDKEVVAACETLVRHLEILGSEALEKNYTKNGKITCTVFVVIGPNAEAFASMARAYMEENKFLLEHPIDDQPTVSSGS